MNVCFTGHRPDKLGGYDWNSKKNQDIMVALTIEITNILDNKEETGETINFISGGALGIDQMAFHICNKLKFTYDDITTEYAIPFLNQACKWNYESKKVYELQKSQADYHMYIDALDGYRIKGYQEDIYYPAKMQKRNEYMVDKSDIVIAVWDGTKGGTGNCVNYAKKQGKKIVRLDPNTLQVEYIN